MVIQFIFAMINKTKWTKILQDSRRSARVVSKVNVMVVGHREDPEYFRMCLESIRTAYANIINLNKVYVIIDGNADDDKYMVEIFFDVFNDKNVKHIELTESRLTDEVLTLSMPDVNDTDIVCITQLHGGKRSAMMTGFKMTLLENLLYKKGIDKVFSTDSDTTITPECVVEMCKYLDSNSDIGAVAGNLGIYNKYDSVVSFMSFVRYWYAFNLERAYQSMTGSVLCVSGPIGLYKLNYLEMILDDWLKQTFLGKLCTYGDDRHLTNKILGLEKKVIYVPSAYAETETPSNWYRFFKQQTRWNKSAFREFFWTLQILDKHSLFMTVDLIYVLFYPYIVMGYLLYILWYKSSFEFGFYSFIVLALGLVKSVYGTITSGKYENMCYFMYTFVYVTTVFPAKLWALISIGDNSWGTSSRKIMKTDISVDIIVPILWNMTLIGGIVYNIWNSVKYGFELIDFLLLIVVFGIWIFCFIVMYVYVTLKNIKKSK
jgi:hyaluronan synthase